MGNIFVSNTRLKLAKKIKKKRNNFLVLNFCCLKTIWFLHPRFYYIADISVLNLVGHVPSWVSCIYCHRTIVPLWVFHGSNFFSLGCFVSSRFFLVGISWVHFFSLVANFAIQRFSVTGCMRKSDRNYKNLNASQTSYSIPNRF